MLLRDFVANGLRGSSIQPFSACGFRFAFCYTQRLGGVNVMHTMKLVVLAGLFCALPLSAQEHPFQPVGALDEVVSKVIARENQEMGIIRQRSPMVET